MLLSPDQTMIRDAVRAFVEDEIKPHAARWDKDHHFPKEVHRGLAALGTYGVCVPAEYGGAGLDYVTLALVLEEIAAALNDAGEILIIGPASAKTELAKYLHEKHPAVGKRIVAVEAADHPTDRQIVAYAKQHFKMAPPRVATGTAG